MPLDDAVEHLEIDRRKEVLNIDFQVVQRRPALMRVTPDKCAQIMARLQRAFALSACIGMWHEAALPIRRHVIVDKMMNDAVAHICSDDFAWFWMGNHEYV